MPNAHWLCYSSINPVYFLALFVYEEREMEGNSCTYILTRKSEFSLSHLQTSEGRGELLHLSMCSMYFHVSIKQLPLYSALAWFGKGWEKKKGNSWHLKLEFRQNEFSALLNSWKSTILGCLLQKFRQTSHCHNTSAFRYTRKYLLDQNDKL